MMLLTLMFLAGCAETLGTCPGPGGEEQPYTLLLAEDDEVDAVLDEPIHVLHDTEALADLVEATGVEVDATSVDFDTQQVVAVQHAASGCSLEQRFEVVGEAGAPHLDVTFEEGGGSCDLDYLTLLLVAVEDSGTEATVCVSVQR